MLDHSPMDPTLTSALSPRTPVSELLGLVPIILGILVALLFLLGTFETGRVLAGRLDTRGQSLAIMLCGLALNASWLRGCAWMRR